MRVSYSWLQDFIKEPLPPVGDIVDALTMHSFEIEEVEEVGLRYPGIVVGTIIAINSHPNADRLQVATVDVGEKEPLQIVCGAPNIETDQLVPVAMIGTTLSNGMTITSTTIRNVQSYGMICSKAELGLEKSSDGIWSLSEGSAGMMLDAVLDDGLFDTVIDIDVLPNRASDCLSHRGIAHEIASIFELSFQDAQEILADIGGTGLSVTINDATVCRRYTGAYIQNVTVTESPQWLQDRLHACGQRPINTVVDATNYMMLHIGQPLHAFDADTFALDDSGTRQIAVRSAHDGERITTLDGEDREISPNAIVITDAVLDTPIALAGIMGGEKTQVTKDTKNLILEAGSFDPIQIRKTSHALKLFSDSSKRFENDITPALTERAMASLVNLLSTTANTDDTHITALIDTYPSPYSTPSISLPAKSVSTLLGVSIGVDDIRSILTRLGCDVTDTANGFTVQPPVERLDITQPVDLIEEVGRIYGYNTVTNTALPDQGIHVSQQRLHYWSHRIRDAFVSRGFSEVITYALRDSGECEIENPLAQDKRFYRSSLVPGISECVSRNQAFCDYLGTDIINVFEIGNVYFDNRERVMLAVGVAHSHGAHQKTDVSSIVADVSAELQIPLGDILNNVTDQNIIEIDITSLSEQSIPSDAPVRKAISTDVTVTPVSIYPYVLRDVALWVPLGTDPNEVEQIIVEHGSHLLVNHYLFDEYTPNASDQTSFAFRLVFQSHHKTLSDEEVNKIMETLYSRLQEKKGWTIR